MKNNDGAKSWFLCGFIAATIFWIWASIVFLMAVGKVQDENDSKAIQQADSVKAVISAGKKK